MCCGKRKTEIKKYENYKEEKMHTSVKKEANGQFRRKMNQDVNGNIKLF